MELSADNASIKNNNGNNNGRLLTRMLHSCQTQQREDKQLQRIIRCTFIQQYFAFYYINSQVTNLCPNALETC